ncbi:AMP-binding protein [Novosphingobium sp. Gsoil 351]|nr:AMP-binding protein [Novosphingobium sp. Gsoil 351]
MAAFTAQLRAIMSLDPSRAEIDFGGRDYTWGEISRVVEGLASVQDALGLPADARVGIALRNRPGHVAAILAVVGGEYCLVSLNPALPDERFAEDIAALGLPVVILDESDAARPVVASALDQAGTTSIIIGAHLEGVRTVQARTSRAGPIPVSRGVAIEMLTSGTTGTPKRVPLTRQAFEASFAAFTSYERNRDIAEPPRLRSGVTMVVNPLTHIGGIYGCIGALVAGRKIALLERFTVAAWVDAVRRNRPKVASAVPSALRMLLDANVDPADLSSLSSLVSGTAPLDPALVDTFYERFGIPVCANYGATEFAGAVAGWTIDTFRECWAQKRGAAGRLHANVGARTVDPETGKSLPPGDEGLLELQGEQLGPGYAIGGERWLRTSDRAVIDADRFLFIRGRADNAIVRGGFKVHPEDVAEALNAHPSVREAAVIGVADGRLGAVPVAAVIPRDSANPPIEAELRQWLRTRLLPYQVPVRFRIVDDFPRTASMKPSAQGLQMLFAKT